MIPELSTPAQQLRETFRLFQKAVGEVPETLLNQNFGGKTRSVAAIVGHVIAAQTRYETLVQNGIDGGEIPTVEFPIVSHATLVDALEQSLAGGLRCLENVAASEVGKPLAQWWGVWVGGKEETALDVTWFAAQMVRHAAYHCGQIYVYALMLEPRK